MTIQLSSHPGEPIITVRSSC